MSHPLLPLLPLLLLPAAALANPEVEAIIAKARQHLGGEAALGAIQTMVYQGTFTQESGDAGEIAIYLKKPDLFRQEIRTAKSVRIVGMDGFVGWEQSWLTASPARKTTRFLTLEQFQRQAATVAENLYFFRGHERRRGAVEDGGPATYLGRPARKVVFRYGPEVVFTRLFDPTNGNLLASTVDQGTETVEEGDLTVAGVRFPTIVKTMKDGRATVVITFQNIEVNRALDDTLFQVPLPGAP